MRFLINLSKFRNHHRLVFKRFQSTENQEIPHNKTFKSYSDDENTRYNAYNELQVSDNASLPEIKQRWLKLSAEMHPDKNPGDPHALERFQKIQEAWADILENKKMDGNKVYICPDTLEEFKYDIEVRPICLVETVEVNKVDKFHTEPYTGKQNFEVLDPLFNVQLWNPLWMTLERLGKFFIVFGVWFVYSYYNNGIVADRLGNMYERFDLEEELVKDDPSGKWRELKMRQKARKEIKGEKSKGVAAPSSFEEGEEDEMIKMLEEMGIKK